jgi:hypothetical protein
MEQIIGKAFKNQKVRIDFSEYEKCTFVNCEIVLEYGITSLVDCDFSKCKLTLAGNAIAIAKIMKLFYPDLPLIG